MYRLTWWSVACLPGINVPPAIAGGTLSESPSASHHTGHRSCRHAVIVIGAAQTYDRKTPVAEVLVDRPDLFYGLARVQYLAKLPYAEIRDNLIDRDFIPAQLIRFFLSVLGMECTTPLSIRYVRGVFFQGMPLAEEIRQGVGDDWRFPVQPRMVEAESAA
jgi:hypothetical protein